MKFRGTTYNDIKYEYDEKLFIIRFGGMTASLNTERMNNATGLYSRKNTDYVRDEFMSLHIVLPFNTGEFTTRVRDGIHRLSAILECGSYDIFAKALTITVLRNIIQYSESHCFGVTPLSSDMVKSENAVMSILQVWAEIALKKYINEYKLQTTNA